MSAKDDGFDFPMSRGCEAEMCPFWTGQGCACDVMGIEAEDRDEQLQRNENLR